jgi:hypothetical protein
MDDKILILMTLRKPDIQQMVLLLFNLPVTLRSDFSYIGARV